MSCCRFSMNSVPSGGVCFIPVIFFAAFVSPLYSSLFLLFSPLSCLSASTHSHALSLGYYQDKSIWSIQGSGCHFIHIFSSLVTLLKATASIYPEWMNARADETRREMRPTQPEMTTANQPVISQRVLQFLGFTCNPKQPGDAEAFGTMFPIHLCVKRHRTARPPARPPVTRERLLRLQAWRWGGETLQSAEAQSRESWRRDKNVSVHANWCPDPPTGCRCRLSERGIKGPLTRHQHFLVSPGRTHRRLANLVSSDAR